MQTERRHTPYPFTWEIPAGIVTAAALALVLGVHAGRAVANWSVGSGWLWPIATALFSSLPAVLGGDADAGLGRTLPSAADPSQVLGWMAAVEVLILLIGISVTAYCLRRWGPGRLKGMATPAEAEASLGLSRLRRVRRFIRPDLYAPRGASHPTKSPASRARRRARTPLPPPPESQAGAPLRPSQARAPGHARLQGRAAASARRA